MDREHLLQLLGELLPTHSPSGDEEEIDALLLPRFREWCAEVRRDPAGNLVGRIPGRSREGAILAMAHKDEIGMVVKRIEPDGHLQVRALGGAHPWKYGEGPVEILGRKGLVPAVLCVGSIHTSAETPRMQRAKEGPLTWDNVYLDAKLSPEALKAAGVHAGTRAVVGRSRKAPVVLGDYVCGWALDDKAALALMLGVMESLAPRAGELPVDLYFAATSEEEVGAASGALLAASVPARTVLALEVAPVAEEYGNRNSPEPVIWYADFYHPYTKRLCDRLMDLAETLGFGAQPVVYCNAGTDASAARRYGNGAEVACIGFPVENSHGYEVGHLEGMLNAGVLLEAFLRG